MDTTSSPQTSTPVRAESFYLDDDPMAIFLVEDQLFKVHRHYFIKGSEIFRDMFSQARTSGESATVDEGMSDEKPIVLSQVTVKEFRALLRFFYTMTLPIPNKKALVDVLDFDQDEKLALLSIAHQFVFDQIFEYICGELEPEKISVVDRVRLGDKYNLDKWLSSAYKAILGRTPNERLSQEEAHALGAQRIAKILEAKNSILHEVYQLPARPNLTNDCSGCIGCGYELYDRYCGSCGRKVPTRPNVRYPTTAMGTAIAQAVQKLGS